MITISLDEAGSFESQNINPVFIAGLIYDDLNENAEYLNERERIKAYYKTLLQDLNPDFSYPADLHSNDDYNHNHNIVKQVKIRINETLAEFITNGTYCGKRLLKENGLPTSKRKGKYHLFVILKSDEAKRNLLRQNTNFLARDNYADNLYFHMAETVVNRIIFHNPLFLNETAPSINIDIATRASGNTSTMSDNKILEYKTIHKSNPDDSFFKLMTHDVYRALIAQEMMNSKHINTKIEHFKISSIYYGKDAINKEFLYLADSICSFFTANEKNSHPADFWLNKINTDISKLNPDEQNLIFAYDEIDNDFKDALTALEQHDIFTAFSILYDCKNKNGTFAKHYQQTLFPFIEQKIYDSITPPLFADGIEKLHTMLQTSNLKQDKLLYLLTHYNRLFEKIKNNFNNEEYKATVNFKLYETALSAYCHIGDPEPAIEYYEKCKSFAPYIGADAILRLNNKLAVCLEDSFEWDSALAIAEESTSCQEILTTIKQEISHLNGNIAYLDEAKAISQKARILSCKRHPDSPKIYHQALSKLIPGSANYKITQSYLLHYLADINDADAFEKEAFTYFDEHKTYPQRLNYLLSLKQHNQSIFSFNYSLYVLLRGLFLFNIDNITDAFWEKLKHLDTNLLDKNNNPPNQHPYEISYKYLEMIAINRNDSAARKKFAELKNSCCPYAGTTINALKLFGIAETADYEKKLTERDVASKATAEYLQKNFKHFKQHIFNNNHDILYHELQNIFTFMYH